MQLATLVLSYSIFVRKEKHARLLKRVFDDTILEFLGEMGETSEASEDDIDALFEALPLDWETTPLPQLRPYLQLESPTRHLHMLLCKIWNA